MKSDYRNWTSRSEDKAAPIRVQPYTCEVCGTTIGEETGMCTTCKDCARRAEELRKHQARVKRFGAAAVGTWVKPIF